MFLKEIQYINYISKFPAILLEIVFFWIHLHTPTFRCLIQGLNNWEGSECTTQVGCLNKKGGCYKII